MAEVIGIASGIAGLVTTAIEITKLSYSFISDIRSAHNTQKQYLREVSALTEVLLRSEEVTRDLGDEDFGLDRPKGLSRSAVAECAQELDGICSELRKPSPRIFWPIKEKTLKKHIEDLHRFRGVFTDFLAAQTLAVTTATHRDVARLSNRQSQKDLLEWIGNPRETSNPVPDFLPGTGEWFLNSEPYNQWNDESGPPLHWCYGPPGVGKSMLAAVAIQDLSAQVDSVCTLHYFFDFGNRKEQTKEAVWKDLLRQVIAKGNDSAVRALTSLRKDLGVHRPTCSKDLSDALKTVCGIQKFVLVLDGADEMENARDLKIILTPFIKANCRILITSRDTPDIRSTLKQASAVEVQADMNDLRAYVVSRFEENDLDELIERHPDLEKDILEKSQGIFLLVRLLIDHLVDLSTVKEMRNALQIYPQHLDQAFESSLQRIDAQSKSHSTLAHRVMGWIISARRKLQMSELIHGLAAEEGVEAIDEENMVSPKTILKVCGGLVVLQGSAVGMVHSTVHTWLRKHYDGLYHKDLAVSCLRYLTMRSFASGVAPTVDAMDARIGTFPFFPYAAQHWRRHLDKTEDVDGFESIDRLLDDPGLRSAAFQASQYKNNVNCPVIRAAALETIPAGQSALHFASYWNLPTKVAQALFNGEDKDATDTQMWTPLHWACFGQSQEAVETLVSHKANPNAKDSAEWTPLFWSALNGDTRTVEFLLQNGASHIARDVDGWTALRWAVASLQMDVAKTLLKHHTNNLANPSNKGSSVLKHLSSKEASFTFTSKNAKGDFVDELEGTSTGPSVCGNDYDDLLTVFQGKSFDIRHLWSSGRFDPPVGNAWRTLNKLQSALGLEHYIHDQFVSEGETAKSWKSRMLQSAIRDGKLLAVRLLIEAGAEVNRADEQTPLHTATFKKDARFADILIKHGAHIEAHNRLYLTPLQLAVTNGFEEVSRLLLSKGANVNAKYVSSTGGKWGELFTASKTPLMLACGLHAGKDDIDLPVRMVQMLLEYGAKVDIKDAVKDGMTALHYAARTRNPRIVKLILDAGVDPEEVDELGRTSVHHLILGGKLYDPTFPCDSKRICIPGPATECLAMLSQKCASDIKHKHFDSAEDTHTPLSIAVVRGDWEIFQALHNIGASFETNVPLDKSLANAFMQLQLPAVELLAKNGATFPRDDSHIRGLCLFSKGHEITPDEVDLFRRAVEILIPRGFDIDATDWNGATLLHQAAKRGTPELLECLLELGANPYQEYDGGVDAFLAACLSQNLVNLKFLLGHTEKQTLASHWSHHLDLPKTLEDSSLLAAVSKALAASGQIDKRCKVGYLEGNILSKAVVHDSGAFVKELLACAADPNLGDDLGRRPLHFAAEKGYATVAKVLIDSGATPDAMDGNQRTPLHDAASEGHHGAVDILLSNGASPDVADYWGWRPLHLAAANGRTEAARLLLKYDASTVAVTSQFACGSGPSGLTYGHAWAGTPLHLAAMAGNAEITRMILQENVNVSARSDSFEQTTEDGHDVPTPGGGPTALHIALGTETWSDQIGCALDRGRLEIASMLIERGASVEGVANHLRFEDVAKFEEFPELWDKLRVGITAEDDDKS